MVENLEQIRKNALERIRSVKTVDDLAGLRVEFLGKKGQLTEILKSMKDVAPEERPKVGQFVNDTRKELEEAFDTARKNLEESLINEKLKSEVIDVTLPGKKRELGHDHPNTRILREVEDIFIGMGYEVVSGPEIEWF